MLLLFRRLATKGFQESVYWDFDLRQTVRESLIITAETPAEPAYSYPETQLVDAWCEGTTRNNIYHVGGGLTENRQEFNSSLCTLPPCGIRIDRVDVSGEELAGNNASAFIAVSGFTGTVEYSLNNFADLQLTPTFEGLGVGSYVAYARPVGNGGCVATYPFQVLPPYGPKWRMEYKTRDDVQARLEIEDRAGSQTVEDLRGGATPVTIDYPAIGSKYDVLGGSGLTIELLVHRAGLLQELYTSDERKYRVSLYENDVLKWRGYLLPEYYEEAWLHEDTHPTARLVASDGIASLADMPYALDNGQGYYGRASQLTVLQRILDKLDLHLPFYTAVNIWATGMDTAIDPLAQAYVQQGPYFGLTCGEVLERILQPYLCMLRQADGVLHIVPHPAKKGPYVRRLYNYKGQYLVAETYEKKDSILRHGLTSYREGSQVVSMRPAITLGRIGVDYGNLTNYIPNGSFEDWDSNGLPSKWTGDAQVLRALDLKGESFLLTLSNTFSGISLGSDLSPYKGLARGVKISFDWHVSRAKLASDCVIVCQLKLGDKYVDGQEQDLKLVDTPETFAAVILPREDTGGFTTIETGKYEAVVQYIPNEGEMQFRIYHPVQTVGSGNMDLLLDNVRVEPYVTTPENKMFIEGRNPGYNSVKPFDLMLHHGSGIPDCGALISLADFTPTNEWGEGYLLQEYTLREILAQHIKPTRIIRATLTGAHPMGVVQDPHMPGARFAVDGYSLDHRTGLATVECQEIFGGADLIPAFAMLTEDYLPILTENNDFLRTE